ncbi:tol-pal system-associated acyl-CoA thioesterase [Gemmobacter sp. 24YEA27]|uniref:tol-pal system-associated acyl-CoA thioesterase n=1 Tax=Gemmobacter sp. 24YEA27 TaxID=3040672 RepID=UPI0024B33C74|nr:tol-pal system-associated acyl-CoA thioesterase [Gemmobacter sp. 24YEA27]
MHEFSLRVWYEDTDLAGIVYYANYLKFIERGRSDWVAARGIDQIALRDQQDIVFAVRRVEADYLRPAKFQDALTVTTTLTSVTGARIVLDQEVRRQDETLFRATVTLVCLTGAGQASRIPAEIRARLAPSLH